MQSNTPQSPAYFFRAKVVVFGKCNDILMKKMQSLRHVIQRRDTADTPLHFQQKARPASRRSNDLNEEAPVGALYRCRSQGHLDIKVWNTTVSKH